MGKPLTLSFEPNAVYPCHVCGKQAIFHSPFSKAMGEIPQSRIVEGDLADDWTVRAEITEDDKLKSVRVYCPEHARRLWAIAWEQLRPDGQWSYPKIDYVHAHSESEARANLPLETLSRNSAGNALTSRIVSVSRAVGFKVLDEHGEKLLA